MYNACAFNCYFETDICAMEYYDKFDKKHELKVAIIADSLKNTKKKWEETKKEFTKVRKVFDKVFEEVKNDFENKMKEGLKNG